MNQADIFTDKLKQQRDALIGEIKVASSSVCGCGQEMKEVKGALWCEHCQVFKVKDAREMFENAKYPFTPLHTSCVKGDK